MAKSTVKATSGQSVITSLQLKRLKNQNLKLQLEIMKGELELTMMNAHPQSKQPPSALDVDQPCLLENALLHWPKFHLWP